LALHRFIAGKAPLWSVTSAVVTATACGKLCVEMDIDRGGAVIAIGFVKMNYQNLSKN
jgi:hypothetical protein